MKIQEFAINLLKKAIKGGKKPDYEKIALEVRRKMKSVTSADNIRWYASRFKSEINQPLTVEAINNWIRAENLVIEHEERKGWIAKKVTNLKSQNLLGYDIESRKEDMVRHIEVKSTESKKKITWKQLTTNQTAIFTDDPDFFIYLVEGDCLKDTEINIVEISRPDLLKMAKYKTVVRFSQFSRLERKSFIRESSLK